MLSRTEHIDCNMCLCVSNVINIVIDWPARPARTHASLPPAVHKEQPSIFRGLFQIKTCIFTPIELNLMRCFYFGDVFSQTSTVTCHYTVTASKRFKQKQRKDEFLASFATIFFKLINSFRFAVHALHHTWLHGGAPPTFARTPPHHTPLLLLAGGSSAPYSSNTQ